MIYYVENFKFQLVEIINQTTKIEILVLVFSVNISKCDKFLLIAYGVCRLI